MPNLKNNEPRPKFTGSYKKKARTEQSWSLGWVLTLLGLELALVQSASDLFSGPADSLSVYRRLLLLWFFIN